MERGIGQADFRGACGISWSTTEKLESGKRKSVHVAHIYELASFYGVDPCRALQADHACLTELANGAAPHVPKLALADLKVRIRRNLRRLRGSQGTPSVAKAADVDQSWLVRIESGQYRNIDILRVYRVLSVLEPTATMEALLADTR